MHRLDIMRQFKITESKTKNKNVVYLYTTLSEIVNQINSQMIIKNDDKRVELYINVLEDYYELIKQEIEDKISDIIAISYKYDYFEKIVKTCNLTNVDRELLLTALISADIDEDKKYISKRLKSFSEYCIDGIYNFRLKTLKEKWTEIASYIPSTFAKKQLKDFIEYIVKEKNGKRVYFENGSIYDKRFNILRRRELLTNNTLLDSTLVEILLSGASEVELCSPLSESEEKYIKELYGSRIILSDNYFSASKKT